MEAMVDLGGHNKNRFPPADRRPADRPESILLGEGLNVRIFVVEVGVDLEAGVVLGEGHVLAGAGNWKSAVSSLRVSASQLDWADMD